MPPFDLALTRRRWIEAGTVSASHEKAGSHVDGKDAKQAGEESSTRRASPEAQPEHSLHSAGEANDAHGRAPRPADSGLDASSQHAANLESSTKSTRRPPPPPPATLQSFQELSDIFSTLDANRDGQVTRQELIKGLEANPWIAEKLGMSAHVPKDEEDGSTHRAAYKLLWGAEGDSGSKTLDLRQLGRYYGYELHDGDAAGSSPGAEVATYPQQHPPDVESSHVSYVSGGSPVPHAPAYAPVQQATNTTVIEDGVPSSLRASAAPPHSGHEQAASDSRAHAMKSMCADVSPRVNASFSVKQRAAEMQASIAAVAQAAGAHTAPTTWIRKGRTAPGNAGGSGDAATLQAVERHSTTVATASRAESEVASVAPARSPSPCAHSLPAAECGVLVQWSPPPPRNEAAISLTLPTKTSQPSVEDQHSPLPPPPLL